MGGYLLTPTCMDPNDGIFPVAYAIVEGKNKASWSWFLALLKHDLGISDEEEHDFTFVSDKQKGLLPAFYTVLPNVNHRFCLRHLRANMKVAGFHGKAIKDTLWTAARATTVNSFMDALKRMKELDTKAFEWLGDKQYSEWSRSHFTTSAKCDMLVNNVSECFNAMLVNAREKPLIICLEEIRTLLMNRLFKNRVEASNWTGPICPNIVKKIAIEEKYAGGYVPVQCELNLFEVTRLHTGEKHKVALGRRSCSCRKWELTGFPCRHAIVAIWMKNCYKVETYMKVYGSSIKPMAGPSEWPHTEKEAPLPPEYKTRPGRPTKLRKKGVDENSRNGIHMSRKHVPLHCTMCKKTGHNLRKCPLNPINIRNAQGRRRVEQRQAVNEQEVNQQAVNWIEVGGEGLIAFDQSGTEIQVETIQRSSNTATVNATHLRDEMPMLTASSQQHGKQVS